MILKSLKILFLAALLSTSVSNADQFGIRPGDSFDDGQSLYCDNPYDPSCVPPDYNDGQDGHYGQTESRFVYISRSVNNSVLDLRRLAGLNSQYRGWEVIAVRGKTQPNSPYTTTVQLIADGRIVATQVNPGRRIRLVSDRRLVLDSSVRNLEMHISGSTFIDELEIEMRRTNVSGPGNSPRPPQQPRPPQRPDYAQQNVDVWINRTTFESDRLDLGLFFNMNQYRGYRIERITVYARPLQNIASADFLINGLSYGTLQFNGYSSQQSLYIQQQPEIGISASSLVLRTRGRMTVQRVTLQLVRY